MDDGLPPRHVRLVGRPLRPGPWSRRPGPLRTRAESPAGPRPLARARGPLPAPAVAGPDLLVLAGTRAAGTRHLVRLRPDPEGPAPAVPAPRRPGRGAPVGRPPSGPASAGPALTGP